MTGAFAQSALFVDITLMTALSIRISASIHRIGEFERGVYLRKCDFCIIWRGSSAIREVVKGKLRLDLGIVLKIKAMIA